MIQLPPFLDKLGAFREQRVPEGLFECRASKEGRTIGRGRVRVEERASPVRPVVVSPTLF
jgi:hypothetical protein